MTATPQRDHRGDRQQFIDAPTHSPATIPVALVLASMALMVPGAVAAVWSLPLPVRGVCAIVSGLAAPLSCSYLFSHGLAAGLRARFRQAGAERIQ